MRELKLRRVLSWILAVVMLCGMLSACTPEDIETLNAMFESLYSSGTDAFGDIIILPSGSDMPSLPNITVDPGTPSTPEPEPVPVPESGITLDELMAQLNEQRQNDVRTTISDSEIFLPDYESDEFQSVEFDEEELALLTPEQQHSPQGNLSYEEAALDIDYLFRLLKTSYAPYEYFGGDEVFDKAKENILADISIFGNTISVPRLEKAIIDNLDFMIDSHFSLNSISGVDFDEYVYYYDATHREFRHDESGYFTLIDNEKYYISSENEQYMKLTVGKTGELVYGLIALCKENAVHTLPKNIELFCKSNYKSLDFKVRWITDSYNYATTLVWKDTVDGIPLTGVGAMMVDNDYCIREMNDFVNYAKTLRDEEVFILDLRGNGGGLSTISYMWLYNLTNGAELEGEYSMIYYMSMLNYFVTEGNDDEIIDALLKFDFFSENPELKDELLSEEDDDEYGEGYILETEDSWNDYDGTVFVLCDKAVASAGEMFLLELMDLENVVIFGTNSNGCLISGGTNYYVPVYLPHSGISVYYSTILILTDDSEEFDAKGILPDVVICGEDEAKAAARCWNYYNSETEN